MSDPQHKRESKKYKNPIPSREYILSFIEKEPKTKYQLFDLLALQQSQQKPLTHRLKAMVRDKQLNCDKQGVYRKFSNKGLLTGTVIANPRGFGFIALEQGGKDLRLSARQMQLVFHGDKVQARLLNQKGDAEIIKVVQSAKTLVGRLHLEKKPFVVVDDKRIKHNISIVELNKTHKNKQIVVVEILKPATFTTLAVGKIIQVFGNYMDEGVETEAALYRNNIPVDFSAAALEKTRQLPTQVIAKDKIGRVDLTSLKLITIDGEDSRDFDDAVYAEADADGWKLWVAIADVSYYISEGSDLDKEAFNRGNSVYFPKRVVPMLPEELSNGLCSLNPQVERLCMTCQMRIDAQGNLLNYKFYPALMYSNARLTYTQVDNILRNQDQNLSKKYNSVIDNLMALHALYKVLKIARKKRGVMDFDRIESQILFNDNGKIDNIIAKKRNDAHKLIEECMLMANQATAKFLSHNDEDFLYRIHPKPKAEKVKVLRQFLSAVGLTLEGGETPESKDFAKVLTLAKGREDENIIKTVVLRTMQQAVYTPANEGHFGLAFEDYTHFTSPIRRYPDLLVHRAIYRVLHKKTRKPSKKMLEIGTHLSMTERRADDATRDVEQWLKCEYMRDKVGETFDGVISGVANFGMFIELADVFVEGMIALRDLKDDYYVFDDIHHQLKGQRRGKLFKLGDPIKIQVASVNLDDRQMVFVPINHKKPRKT